MLFVALAIGCRTPPAVDPPTYREPATHPVWDGAHTVVLGEGRGCTVVAVHGYGSAPDRFARLYRDMELDAVVVLPRGPIALGSGWAWFPLRRQGQVDGATYGEAIRRAAERLADGIAAGVPGARSGEPPVITGFSQGGMAAWVVAVEHPDRVRASLPVGGLLPPSAELRGRPVPIEVFHGEADTVVPYAADRAGVDRLRAAGWDVALHAYPGLGHQISAALRDDYENALRRACGSNDDR